jgi:hypothetical protein
MPARRIPPKTRSQSGRFWSRKNGRVLVGYESLLEHDYCVVLEFDETVRTYESQLVAITCRRPHDRKCTGYPDFLVTYEAPRDPMQAIVDVTTEKRLVNDWAGQSDLGGREQLGPANQ